MSKGGAEGQLRAGWLSLLKYSMYMSGSPAPTAPLGRPMEGASMVVFCFLSLGGRCNFNTFNLLWTTQQTAGSAEGLGNDVAIMIISSNPLLARKWAVVGKQIQEVIHEGTEGQFQSTKGSFLTSMDLLSI